MNIEVFLHGVPYGQDYYGLEEETIFFQKFYNNESGDIAKLVVETRNSGGKYYTYYTYLRNKDVVDARGRAGSYFGLTLRLDEFCINLKNVYHILETVYEKNVVGTILLKDGPRMKYSRESFNDLKSDFDGVQNAVIQLFKYTFTAQDFVKAGPEFIGKASAPSIFNVWDMSNELSYDIARQHSTFALNKFSLSQKEKAFIEEKKSMNDVFVKRESELKQAAELEKQSMNTKLETVEAKISELQGALSQKDAEMNQLKLDFQKKEEELRKSSTKELEQSIKTIKEPITALARYFERITPKKETEIQQQVVIQPQPEQNHHLPGYGPINRNQLGLFIIINTALLLLVIVLILGISLKIIGIGA